MKALQFSVTVPQFVALKVLGLVSKKLYYEGPLATARLVDVPEPSLPSPEWVKIKNYLCGFCASDLNLILLRDSPTASPFTSFPCTMGHEISGEVVETGSAVTNVRVGDMVTIAPHLDCGPRGMDPVCRACRTGRTGNCENMAEGIIAPGMFNGICRDTGGGFGQYQVAHYSQVYKLPDGMSLEEGALVEPYAVALQAVADNRPEPGDEVLVIGGGVIGTMVVKAIRALDIDCRISVSETSPFHAEAIKRSGADRVFTDGDVFSQAVTVTGARRYKPMIGTEILMGGFNRIFDVVGNTATINTSLRALAVDGVLSVVGIGHDVKLDLTPLWLKLQTIRGVYSYGFTEAFGERKHVFQAAIEFIAGGKTVVKDMMTHKFSLDRFREMIETNLNKGKYGAIKTMVSHQ